jgi:hypothetical protein
MAGHGRSEAQISEGPGTPSTPWDELLYSSLVYVLSRLGKEMHVYVYTSSAGTKRIAFTLTGLM